MVAHKFTLVLSRDVTDDELTMLREAGPGEVTASTTKLPTNPDVKVRQLDFDTEGESLAAVLKAALEAVRTVPDLSVSSLSVPAREPDGEATGGTQRSADEPAVVGGR
ncbi:hypothetical protein LX83_004296 [Goodfellowiella coeruleoviolacea]|uniref:Uncharacterized protein n=2 Tax=Goodfellowiella coeruleoviolacea TaxID=334858 RepID=A0AAE3KMC2_9PSEU|nr:hypothetical protein [Goodfellowiella coeruleoviolacea]